MGSNIDGILRENLTLEELQEWLTSSEGNKLAIDDHIKATQGRVLPLRLLFNEFLRTISHIEQLSDKTPQEKFQLIRSKLQELYGKLHALVRDFQRLQPLFDTMVPFSETSERKFYPKETLGTAVEPVRPLASPSYRRPSNRSSADTPSSNAPTPSAAVVSGAALVAPQVKHQRRPRTNTAKRQPSVSASVVPSANSSGPATIPGATPLMLSGMSPLNMVASPLNGISPSRKPAQPHHQTTPSAALGMQPMQQKQMSIQAKATPSKSGTISSANLTPQSILNMSAFENSAGGVPNSAVPLNQNNNAIMGFPTDIDNIDLNALELGSLNMDLLG